MGNLATITVNVDFETIRQLTGMDTDQIEREEGNIDSALFQAFQREFGEAEEVKASCGYVSSVTVEARDDDGDPVCVDVSRVSKAIQSAVNDL